LLLLADVRKMASVRAPFVLIVSRNTSDALSLQSFFQLCGLECATSSRMDTGKGESGPSVVVVFPDEFSAMSADGVRRLIRRFAEATVVIVTFAVAFFESLVQNLEGRECGTLVLPLPSWGWVLTARLLGVSRTMSGRDALAGASTPR
jgi:hypothetical protein